MLVLFYVSSIFEELHFSLVAEPVYNPNCAKGYPFLHIFAKICYRLFSMIYALTGMKWYLIVLPWWLVILNMSLCSHGHMYTFLEKMSIKFLCQFFFNGVVFCCFYWVVWFWVCVKLSLILRIINNFNFKNKDILYLKVLMNLCSSYLFVY